VQIIATNKLAPSNTITDQYATFHTAIADDCPSIGASLSNNSAYATAQIEAITPHIRAIVQYIFL
jgi:hypothetical protein